MSKFNPDNAVPVDEDDEDQEMNDFMDRLERKAKSFRSQMIADAFKELANVAKDERKLLLRSAAQDFSALVSGVVDDAAKQLTEDHAALGKKVEGKLGDMNAGMGRLEKTMRQLDAARAKSGDEPTRAMIEALQTAVSGVHNAITAAESRRATEMTALVQSVQASIDALRNAPAPKRPTYTFRVDRDDHNRITNITATAAE